MKRRDFTKLVGAVSIAGLAGCSDASGDLPAYDGPEPDVSNVSVDQSVFGPDTFKVLVSNSGGSGDILVTVALFHGSGLELDSVSKKVYFSRGQTKVVTIEMDIHSRTEYYEATVEAL